MAPYNPIQQQQQQQQLMPSPPSSPIAPPPIMLASSLTNCTAHLQLWTGENLIIDLSTEWTVGRLKEAIDSTYGVPIAVQQLGSAFDQQEWSDATVLSRVGIRDGSLICLWWQPLRVFVGATLLQSRASTPSTTNWKPGVESPLSPTTPSRSTATGSSSSLLSPTSAASPAAGGTPYSAAATPIMGQAPMPYVNNSGVHLFIFDLDDTLTRNGIMPPTTRRCLETLAQQHRLAIASFNLSAVEFLKNCGCLDLFDVIVCGFYQGVSKVDHIRKVLSEMQWPSLGAPSRGSVYFFDDQPTNVEDVRSAFPGTVCLHVRSLDALPLLVESLVAMSRPRAPVMSPTSPHRMHASPTSPLQHPLHHHHHHHQHPPYPHHLQHQQSTSSASPSHHHILHHAQHHHTIATPPHHHLLHAQPHHHSIHPGAPPPPPSVVHHHNPHLHPQQQVQPSQQYPPGTLTYRPSSPNMALLRRHHAGPPPLQQSSQQQQQPSHMYAISPSGQQETVPVTPSTPLSPGSQTTMTGTPASPVSPSLAAYHHHHHHQQHSALVPLGAHRPTSPSIRRNLALGADSAHIFRERLNPNPMIQPPSSSSSSPASAAAMSSVGLGAATAPPTSSIRNLAAAMASLGVHGSTHPSGPATPERGVSSAQQQQQPQPSPSARLAWTLPLRA